MEAYQPGPSECGGGQCIVTRDLATRGSGLVAGMGRSIQLPHPASSLASSEPAGNFYSVPVWSRDPSQSLARRVPGGVLLRSCLQRPSPPTPPRPTEGRCGPLEHPCPQVFEERGGVLGRIEKRLHLRTNARVVTDLRQVCRPFLRRTAQCPKGRPETAAGSGRRSARRSGPNPQAASSALSTSA